MTDTILSPADKMSPGSLLRILYLLLLAGLACAFGASRALAFEAPAFQSDVLDETATLSQEESNMLRQRIRELRESNGIWAAIYVTQGLQGDSIESASVATFEKWKLGQAGKDNGLLIMIAPKERKMRIEVGYGLEGFITDVFSKRVIDDIYKPAFRESRFASGLMQGFDVMALAAQGEAPAPQPEVAFPQPPTQADFDGGLALRLFGATFVFNFAPAVLFALAWLYGRRKGRVTEKSLGEVVSTPLIFCAFFGVFFGLFIGVFGAAFASEPDGAPLTLLLGLVNAFMAGLFALPSAFRARRYLFASAFRRDQARDRLIRIKKRSKVARKIFGVWFDPAKTRKSEGGTMREPRSSSSSFSSSSSSSSSTSSSSSGGGSSGGGGASGSW